KIKKFADTIKRLSKKTAYKINFESEKPTIFDSKFAGLPYWTKDKEYPKNSEGKKLLLLAQINFDQYKFNSPLPSNGMLQFFIYSDDILGLNFDNQIEQDGFRVVYHEKINYDITEESIRQLGVPESIKDLENDDNDLESFPIEKEIKISFSKEMDSITHNDKNFNKYFTTVYNMIYDDYITVDKGYFGVLNDKDEDKLNDELFTTFIKHKLLGYPFFTQDDPRHDKKYSDYILLLQIDTDKSIMWGDSGVCNFFIEEKALLEKDFSKVLYNWDC
ncbi:hypothetical protein PIROE2DRAFT_36965, partial [Piromyces sp. E2]